MDRLFVSLQALDAVRLPTSPEWGGEGGLSPRALTSGGLSLGRPERERAGRFADVQARREFLAGRAALRFFAAGLLEVEPSRLAPHYDCPRCGSGQDHGRPGFLLDGGPAPLLLSASRASGWVLLAAVVQPEPGHGLGVDVENVVGTEFAGFDDVALTAREFRHLNTLEPGYRAQERARLWARKEAWLKMTGEGLRVRPDSLDVLEQPGLRDLDLPASANGRDLPAGLAAAVAVRSASTPRQLNVGWAGQAD